MAEDKFIVLYGTKEKIVYSFSEQFCLEFNEGKRVFNYLENHMEILSREENFERYWLESKGIGYVTPGFKYYINIKVTTIILMLFLLDSIIPNNLVSLFIMLTGISTKTIVRLREGTIEKCILKEILCSKKKQGTKNLLRPFNGECCNNQYPCPYRTEGRCNCSTNQIEEVLESFVNGGLMKKKGNVYYYQF